MKLTWDRIGVIAGALVAVGTVLYGLGYGWPWPEKKDVDGIKDRENTHYQQIRQDLVDVHRGLDDQHVDSLLTQKSILLMQEGVERKAHDADSAAQTRARIEWLDQRLAHPNRAAPPLPE